VGDDVGAPVSTSVGDDDGDDVGAPVSTSVGDVEGELVGSEVKVAVGDGVGAAVKVCVGDDVGVPVGDAGPNVTTQIPANSEKSSARLLATVPHSPSTVAK